MNTSTEKKAQRKSSFLTLIITIFFLTALFFLKFKYYDPPIEDAIAINFGYDRQGKTKEETTDSKSSKLLEKEKVSKTNKQPESQPEESKSTISNTPVITQKEKSPVIIPPSEKKHSREKKKADNIQKIKNPDKKNNTKNNSSTSPKKEEKKLDARLGKLRTVLKGKGKNLSVSDGQDTNIGNKGILEGLPDTQNYEGSIAKGTRKLINRPAIPDFNQCPNNEYGKLVVSYKVNAQGNVIHNSVIFNSVGTNIIVNSCIKQLIKRYLFQLKYESSKKDFETTSQTFNILPQ